MDVANDMQLVNDWEAVFCALTPARYARVQTQADRINDLVRSIERGEVTLYPVPKKSE